LGHNCPAFAKRHPFRTATPNLNLATFQAEIELDQLRREESGSALTARDQVRTVTAGWLVGVVLGWSGGLVLGCLFSPALGFMLVGARVVWGLPPPLPLSERFDTISILDGSRFCSTLEGEGTAPRPTSETYYV